MAAKVRTGSRPGKARRDDEPLERNIGCAVNAAIKLGFVVGREVLVGKVPGLVVGYNIAGMGSFAVAIIRVIRWGCSSVGRARRSQRRGQRFDPAHLHHSTPAGLCAGCRPGKGGAP
jgi:hypothetical protein